MTIPRNFTVRYNPYTESVEIINTKSQLEILMRDIKYELEVLIDAFKMVPS